VAINPKMIMSLFYPQTAIPRSFAVPPSATGCVHRHAMTQVTQLPVLSEATVSVRVRRLGYGIYAAPRQCEIRHADQTTSSSYAPDETIIALSSTTETETGPGADGDAPSASRTFCKSTPAVKGLTSRRSSPCRSSSSVPGRLG